MDIFREFFNPKITDRGDRWIAALLIVCGLYWLAVSDWLLGIVLIIYGLYTITAQITRYHAYRSGYWLGVLDRDRGFVREDPHPDDMPADRFEEQA